MAHPKTAGTDHEILEVIRTRWSPRAFDPDRAVDRADLLRLFEAARWAPSSSNEQPWRFVLADRRDQPEAFDRLLGTLTGSNPDWAARAPVLLLVTVREDFERYGVANAHAYYDTGQAVAQLTMQATALGLGVRQIAGFDPDRAREACAVPAPFRPAVVIAIGYAGDPATLAREKHRAAEGAPRKRRPLREFVFAGRWDQPLP
ncbi:MAG: nitroreductase family protein [Vicinamibacterales bacterium]